MKSPRVRPWLSSLTARLFSVAAAFAALTGTGSLAMEPAHPQVYFDGCVAIRRTGSESICLTKPGSELTLWAESTACEGLYVTESGVAKDPYHQPVYGGCQFRIPLGNQQDISTLELRSVGSDNLLFRLHLDRSQPTFLEHKERMEVRALSDVSEEYLLQRMAESNTRDEKIDWTWTLAIVYERKGYTELAIHQYRLLAELSGSYPSIVVSAHTKIGELLYQAREFEDARQALMQIKDLRDARDTARELEWTHWSVVLPDVTSQEGAQILDRAVRLAEAVRSFEQQRTLTIWLVQALSDINRIDDASRALNNMDIDGLTSCKVGILYANQAWLAMDLLERMPQLAMPLKLGNKLLSVIQEKAGTLQDHTCATAGHMAKLQNGKARLALLEGRLEDAIAAIEKAKSLSAGSMTPWVALSLLDMEAQWSLRSGRVAQASQLFDTLLRRSAASDDPKGFQCRAAVGLVEVAHSLRQEPASHRALLDTCLPEVKSYNPPLYMNLARRLKKVSAASQ